MRDSVRIRKAKFDGEGETLKNSYTVAEVTRILGITRQSVYKLIKENAFKAVKLEKQYRIVRSSFDKWLLGNERRFK